MIASFFECGGKYVKFFNFVAIFAKRLKGPKLLFMEIPIPNFCPLNRHGNSKGRGDRTSELESPCTEV